MNKQLMESIRLQLWSINRLPLPQIYNAILQLIPHGIHSFIPMMRDCIQATKYDPALLQYIILFDMMLNEQVFNELLHSCLAEFYPRIVSYLQKRKLSKEVEEAKIMRKYWAKRIHPYLYAALKTETYRLTNIDVDNILSLSAIQNLRAYYTQVLRLPPQELSYYLPQQYSGQLSYSQPFAHKNNNYSNIGSQLSYGSHNSLKERPSIKRTSDDSKQIVAKPVQKMDRSNSRMNLNDRNDSLFAFASQTNFDFPKKIRFQSEQTNVDVPQDRPRKIRHLNPLQHPSHISDNQPTLQHKVRLEPINTSSPLQTTEQSSSLGNFLREQANKVSSNHQDLLKAINMLNQLNSLNQFECKQCGMRFQTQESRRQHVENHLKSKLQVHNLKQMAKFKPTPFNQIHFKTTKEWIAGGLQQEKRTDLVNPISQDQTNHFKYECVFCGNAFHQRFTNGLWIYQNAVKTVILNPGQSYQVGPKKHYIMHQGCAKEISKSDSVQTKWIKVAK